MPSENTPAKRKGEHLVAHQFKPGNPGRPKGARNKFGEEFINDFLADWTQHGMKAITDMREDDPGAYVRVAASIIPKELNVKVNDLDELSDEQIARQLAFIASQLAAAGLGVGEGTVAPVAPGQAGDIPTIQ